MTPLAHLDTARDWLAALPIAALLAGAGIVAFSRDARAAIRDARARYARRPEHRHEPPTHGW